jgi:YHS domain-containing protein
MRIGIASRKLARAGAALAACALFVANAWAGDFFEKDGVALRGYDPVAYVVDGKPVRGSAQHTATYKGSTFRFASSAHRDAFVAEPARYAPQYAGFCAFGVAGGYKAATDPEAFTVVDGKLYLNYSLGVRRQWSADIPGFVAKADRNWSSVAGQARVVQ